jgi:hypothetical protein
MFPAQAQVSAQVSAQVPAPVQNLRTVGTRVQVLAPVNLKGARVQCPGLIPVQVRVQVPGLVPVQVIASNLKVVGAPVNLKEV